MADYWISQKRHFCEFCKCWTADNKPSREFHEKGKNHQQNVQRKITETMKKSQKDTMEKNEMDATMKQIEQAALQALQKDLKQDPNMASRYGVKIKSKEKNDPDKNETTSTSEQRKDSTETSTKDRSKTSADASPDSSTSEDPNLVWKEEWTPEGFVYYWHIESGESRWVKPEGYIPTWERAVKEMQQEEDDIEVESTTSNNTEGEETLQEQPDTKEQPAETVPQTKVVPEVNVPQTTTEPACQVPLDPLAIGDIPLPDSTPKPPEPAVAPPEPQDPEEPVEPPPEVGPPTRSQSSVRAATSAYGAWETIPQQHELPEPVDLQLPVTQKAIEVQTIPISEPKIKFRQKKVDTLGAEFVAFKKRKMSDGPKRSIRTTDTEKD